MNVARGIWGQRVGKLEGVARLVRGAASDAPCRRCRAWRVRMEMSVTAALGRAALMSRTFSRMSMGLPL